MLIKPPKDIRTSDITPESTYHDRRRILIAGLAAGLLPGLGLDTQAALPDGITIDKTKLLPYSPDEVSNFDDVTGYNNYYEFGTGKTDPSRYAHTLITDPWSVKVEGEAENTGTFTLEDILKPHTFEQRVYRLRCVEAWSAVVPWVGFPLADLLKRFAPTSKAKYVQFFTLYDTHQMPGMRYPVLDWPYREGLTIAEAMNPLTIMAVGLYGRPLPNQNGAPLRLVVPWKYGFKSIKSIVRIRFQERQPQTSWNMAIPREYGFYSNVNPNVDHPRWSQASERPIGGGLFSARVPTLMFNGYGTEVAHLYRNLDLVKNY